MKQQGRWAHLLRSLFLAVVASAVLSCAGEQGTVVEKGIIKSNTTWQDRIVVKGDVEIAYGVTLTIQPGTTIKFAKIADQGADNLYTSEKDFFERAELIVRGTIVARGTKEQMIRFTSAERSPRPGDWGAINLQDSAGNVFEYCEISYSNSGIHGHGAQAIVRNCNIHDNGVGIAFKSVEKYETPAMMDIQNNRIVGNAGGVLCGKNSRSAVLQNEITNNKLYGILGKRPSVCDVKNNNIAGNGKGILVYATKGFRINQNNLSDNSEYHISLLEGQRWDVDARNNWWGTTNRNKIGQLIWDAEEERGLGRVQFSGLADGPFKNAGVTG